jgi:hypothetical protein
MLNTAAGAKSIVNLMQWAIPTDHYSSKSSPNFNVALKGGGIVPPAFYEKFEYYFEQFEYLRAHRHVSLYKITQVFPPYFVPK